MNVKFKFLAVVFGGISILSCAQPKSGKAQIDSSNMYQTYVAHKTSEPMTIDGKANETAWKNAKWTNCFIDIEGVKTPKYKTRAKMLWDEGHFYILAEMEEPHVWADITERDAVIFYNNDFEVFIDPDGDSHNYYELEVNAVNTAWDLFITKPYRELNNPILDGWDYNGLKSAVSVDGTLNDPRDIDKGWTLEIAIPFKDLRTSYGQDNVPRDTFWRVNFSRVNWDFQLNDGDYGRKKDANGKFLHEYNWVWSPLGVINMHEPEKWGYVYFSSEEVGADVAFSIPQDDKIKWKLFEFYRAQKAHHLKKKTWLATLDFDNIEIDGETIKPKLENHSQGWNIIVESPFSGKRLVIREDGKFMAE